MAPVPTAAAARATITATKIEEADAALAGGEEGEGEEASAEITASPPTPVHRPVDASTKHCAELGVAVDDSDGAVL